MEKMAGGTLRIGNREYEFVKKRAYSSISVYKGSGTYLRMGNTNDVKKDMEVFEKLRRFGFPVARLIKEGKVDGQSFYVEESLGDVHMGEIFMRDCSRSGTVSAANFKRYIDMTRLFCEAQLRSATKKEKFDIKGFFSHKLFEERPDLKHDTIKALKQVKDRTSVFPMVITHGDLNPFNFMPKGIIDFEFMFYGPAGYDAITNLYHIYAFPKTRNFSKSRKYEMWRGYDFTAAQRVSYLNAIDDVYVRNGLPKPSDYKDDFIFGRIIWSAVQLQKFPKTREWRYSIYEKILQNYLCGKPIIETIVNFPS